MAAAAPRTPGAVGTRLAQEALDSAPGKRRPALAAFSSFSFVPPRREGPPELSYFNRPPKTGDFFTYDAIFRPPEGYDQYLPRCDRKHAKARGLKINEEPTACDSSHWQLYTPDIAMQVCSHNALQLHQTVQEVLDAPKGIPGVRISITCSCLVTQLQICEAKRESLHGLVVAQGFSSGFDFFHAVLSLNCASREMARSVPVATSSQYGKRVNKPLDPATGEHARVYSLHAAIYGESSRTAH